jgi:hypothetical protein
MSYLRNLAVIAVGLTLASCGATTNLQSSVSTVDIPGGKYKKMAVFIEGQDAAERRTAEEAVISALRSAGVNAVSGDGLLAQKKNASNAEKVRLVKSQGTDALLYVKVLRSREALISNARWDQGRILIFADDGTVTEHPTLGYTVKPDGSIYQKHEALSTSAELQDINSAKLVWAGSAGTGQEYTLLIMGIPVGGQTHESLVAQASKDVVSKMRADGAI